MNLTIFKKPSEQQATVEHMPSLEVLLRSAMALGRIELKQDYNLLYKMEIMFESKGGSLIFARASSSLPEEAISKAIQEAYRLGATK